MQWMIQTFCTLPCQQCVNYLRITASWCHRCHHPEGLHTCAPMNLLWNVLRRSRKLSVMTDQTDRNQNYLEVLASETTWGSSSEWLQARDFIFERGKQTLWRTLNNKLRQAVSVTPRLTDTFHKKRNFLFCLSWRSGSHLTGCGLNGPFTELWVRQQPLCLHVDTSSTSVVSARLSWCITSCFGFFFWFFSSGSCEQRQAPQSLRSGQTV